MTEPFRRLWRRAECAAGLAIDAVVFAVPGGTILSSAGAIVRERPVTILGPDNSPGTLRARPCNSPGTLREHLTAPSTLLWGSHHRGSSTSPGTTTEGRPEPA
ncbi:MAG: hypothetical protein KJ058_00825 [Thermoanaerobaculia bacterium]|nr:hypothetical protein [Thermoanaerobaculia bacterium]